MNDYKIVLIVKSGADSKGQAKKVSDLITELKGKPQKTEFLGKKQFSYPIKKNHEGDYYQIVFSISPTKTATLKKELLQKELVWRFLIVKDINRQ